jgi:hypothetical protein
MKPQTLKSLRRNYDDLLEYLNIPITATEAVGDVFSSEPEMKEWLRSSAQMILIEGGDS